MTPRNIRKKPWYKEAVNLDDFIEQLLAFKEELGDRPCRVIGVINPLAPVEANIVGTVTRSKILDEQVAQHLNALAGEANDVEISETSEDAEHELARDGEVLYICLGPAEATAPREIYEL